MTDRASLDDIAAIRALLISAFATAEDLRRFCYDRPLLRPLLVDLGPKDSLSDIADKVIVYCQSKLLRDDLLPEVAQVNPRQYKQFVPPLPPIPLEPPAVVPPLPPIPLDPPAKVPEDGEGRRSSERTAKGPEPKRVPWWAIAALVLLGACLLLVGYLLLRPPPPLPLVVAVRTAHGRYVTAMDADDEWRLRSVSVAETDVLTDCQKFTLLCQSNGMIALQTCRKMPAGNNRYVTAMNDEGDRDWELRGQAEAPSLWERLTLLHADTGTKWSCSKAFRSLREDGTIQVAFRTYHKKDGKHRLITAMGDDWSQKWVLRAETNELLGSEKLTIILAP